MQRSVASVAPLPGLDVDKSAIDARLTFVEFLLASADLQASARQGIEWLAAHAGVRQALVAVVDPASPNLLLIAEHDELRAQIKELERKVELLSAGPARRRKAVERKKQD